MKGSSESAGVDGGVAAGPADGLTLQRWGAPVGSRRRSGHDLAVVAGSEAGRGSARASGGWLFGGVDRKRLLDMDRRIQPVRRQTVALLIAGLLVSAPWVGFWTLVPAFVAAALFALATRRSPHSAHPERMIFGAWVGSEVIIAASVALSGGSRVASYAWLAIPVVTLPARFPGRPLKVGVLIALGLLAAVALGTDFRGTVEDPVLVFGPAGVIVCVALLSTALMRSDLEHRGRCVIDELTGMLNRAALETRSAELVQQSEITGEPVGLVVADVDHFKEFNDSEGHAVGDLVLAEVAYRIRKQLRAFDLVYRFGGEEFVVLAPETPARDAVAVAERLRRAVAERVVTTPHGIDVRVTVSCGVATLSDVHARTPEELLGHADAALYAAKARGRDRTEVAEPIVDEEGHLRPPPAPITQKMPAST